MITLLLALVLCADPAPAKTAVDVYVDFERERFAKYEAHLAEAKAALKGKLTKAQREEAKKLVATRERLVSSPPPAYLLLHDHKIGSCGMILIGDTLSVARIIDGNTMIAEWKSQGLGYGGRPGAVRTKYVFVAAPTGGLADESKLDKAWHYAITKTEKDGAETHFYLEKVDPEAVKAKRKEAPAAPAK